MKTRIIIILIFIGFFMAFQLYLGIFRSSPVQSNYKVVRAYDEFEIRSYTPLTGSVNNLVAVLKFGGYASPRVVQFYNDKLETILFQNAISQSGDFHCLQYNSPYQIVGRSNEILVGIGAMHNLVAGSTTNSAIDVTF
ncbi:MAG: heme-binding protein [Dyadobacter sp.]|uniref:heme-binding protein n=1 Tax=Dyadobacter sp. TaxID=1914288 RepID=UPI003265B5F3